MLNEIKTVHRYDVALDEGAKEVRLPQALMHQDAMADEFRVSVSSGGNPVDLSGARVYGYLYFSATQTTILLAGAASGSEASVVLDEACYAMPGYASLVIQLHQDDVRHTVLRVNLCIQRTGTENVIDPGDVLPTLAELLAQIDAMEAATDAARQAVQGAMVNRKSIAADADFNSIVEDGIYYAYYPNTHVNSPDNGAGLLTVTVQNSVITQDWVNIACGTRSVRYCQDGEWRDWMNHLPDTIMQNRKSMAADADFNDIVEDGIYYAYYPNTHVNSPDGGAGLLTVTTQGSVITQDWVNIADGTRSVRYRHNGTWYAWNAGNLRDSKAVYYAFGDSTTYGELDVGGQSAYNYPACVGKALEMVVKNKGVPGQSLIVDWDKIHVDFIDGLDMSDAALISVGWAYNTPESETMKMHFGAATDTTPDTFVGKYYTIMREFQEKCPQAQVVLITGFGAAGNYAQFTSGFTFKEGVKSIQTMYNTLEEMCHLNGWNCINQAKGTWINKLNKSTYIGEGDGTHPNDAGYIRYGGFIAAKMKAIYSNLKKW